MECTKRFDYLPDFRALEQGDPAKLAYFDRFMVTKALVVLQIKVVIQIKSCGWKNNISSVSCNTF